MMFCLWVEVGIGSGASRGQGQGAGPARKARVLFVFVLVVHKVCRIWTRLSCTTVHNSEVPRVGKVEARMLMWQRLLQQLVCSQAMAPHSSSTCRVRSTACTCACLLHIKLYCCVTARPQVTGLKGLTYLDKSKDPSRTLCYPATNRSVY